MKNKLLKNIFFFCCLFCFISCKSSSEQTPQINQNIDYTKEDVRNNEVKRIKEILMLKPIEALWRSVLLEDKELLDSVSKYVRDYCITLLEQKEYRQLYFTHRSLCSAGFEKLANEVILSSELNKLFFSHIPGNNVKKNKGSGKDISTFVSGTVTIWVDLGIKVQHGMGYADRVIGSGFFIDDRGYLITNYHVISNVVDPKYEGYGKVYIKLSGEPDNRIPAKVIGWDPVHDLALLKAEIDPPYVFSLGSSTDIKIGDKIYAIGSPLGLESTLTSGVVSSTNRKLFSTGSVLQIDAAINSGNSGGPCIDLNGNVQAVVFAGILQYQGLNFAVPIEYLKQELPILYYGGLIQIPWIGAYGKTLKSGSKDLGVEILYFSPGSPMHRAGMKKGDIITKIDGKNISSIEDIQDVLRKHFPDTIVKCEYINEKKEKKNCLLYLTARPKSPGYHFYQSDTIQNSFIPLFGISMVPASSSNSRTYLITDVINGSIADESGFSENDPITVGKIHFDDNKTMMLCEISVKRRKRGYLDMTMGMSCSLDSPYYF